MNFLECLTELVKTSYRDIRGLTEPKGALAHDLKMSAKQLSEMNKNSSPDILTRLNIEACSAHKRLTSGQIIPQLLNLRKARSVRLSRLLLRQRGLELRNDSSDTLAALSELEISKVDRVILSAEHSAHSQRPYTQLMPPDDGAEPYINRNVVPGLILQSPSTNSSLMPTSATEHCGPQDKPEPQTWLLDTVPTFDSKAIVVHETSPTTSLECYLIPSIEASAAIMDISGTPLTESVFTIGQVKHAETPVTELPTPPYSPTFEHSAEDLPTDDQNLDHWGTVNLISPEAVEKLAMEHAPLGAENVVYIGDTAGQHNRVFLVEFRPNREQRILRIPASGWMGKWCEKDKYQLTRTNNIMRYLKDNTEVPVPKVFYWDVELDNSIGAPYTIMERVNGMEPSQLWFKDIFDDDDDEEDERDDEDDSSDINFRSGFRFRPVNRALEQKRQKILKSLASTVAELRHLKFDKMGALSFSGDLDGQYEIGPREDLCFGRKRQNAEVDESLAKVYDFTSDFFHARFRHISQEIYMEEGEDEYLWAGLYRLYKVLIRCLPVHLDFDVPETFVLAPPDFGSQNLLCDDDGNITAILDWDTAETRPRMVGWCLPPDWLIVDWFGNQIYTWPNQVMAPNDIEKYRQQYAHYLREACHNEPDSGDWKYAEKAPMFDAILRSMTNLDQDQMLETMTNLLNTFLPRVDHKQLIIQLGKEVKATDISGMIHWSQPMLGPMEQFFLKGFSDLCGTTPNCKTFDGVKDESIDGEETPR
ncbi:hypothetical protein FKW77_010086 [Venturia effusa]|uniref:Aminoglycoside phosphotransferase domain-containing protein n=1 Tax=Venturia effusa TaxID=50376 RepID=A0A517L699_9PEZI|nr:hypothetical protein FKW77_010086 [Venturia effusa]